MAKNKEEKRNHILQAAIKVFARKGFFQAKISEIAHEANVADGTIYLYFENKDHLLIAIFEEEMDKIITVFGRHIATKKTAAEKLHAFIGMHADFVVQNPDLAHVLQVELRQSTTFMSDYRPVKFQDFLNILETIIVNGQKNKEFKTNIHPGVIKRAIFGALDELALHWVMRGRNYDLEKSAQQLAEIFVQGLTST